MVCVDACAGPRALLAPRLPVAAAALEYIVCHHSPLSDVLPAACCCAPKRQCLFSRCSLSPLSPSPPPLSPCSHLLPSCLACTGLLINAIKWNFTKFLVVDGVPRKRYAPNEAPSSFEADVVAALEETSGVFAARGGGERARL